jgi:hypothetical protein
VRFAGPHAPDSSRLNLEQTAVNECRRPRAGNDRRSDAGQSLLVDGTFASAPERFSPARTDAIRLWIAGRMDHFHEPVIGLRKIDRNARAMVWAYRTTLVETAAGLHKVIGSRPRRNKLIDSKVVGTLCCAVNRGRHTECACYNMRKLFLRGRLGPIGIRPCEQDIGGYRGTRHPCQRRPRWTARNPPKDVNGI